MSRKGEPTSEEIYSSPWNPIFVALVDDKTEDRGCIFFPGLGISPMVFSNNGEDTPAKISRWLGGDPVFIRAVEKRTTDNTAVAAAVEELDPEEIIDETKQVWKQTEDRNGNPKMMQMDEPIPRGEQRAKNIIYCETPEDAVAAFFHLKALRYTYPATIGKRWYHVCFPFGRVSFSSVHYNKMHRFAENIYTLFSQDTKAMTRARDISCRYRDIMRAALPETMRDRAHLFMPRVHAHPVQSLRDFFLAYKMLPRESFQFDYDLNRLFSTCVTSALCSDPFERKEKRDRNGMVKEIFYTINPATLWEFMASMGYARDVQQDSSDKIGRYMHIDGPFADELDPASMVQATIDNLKAYARQLNDSRPGSPDE